MEKFIERLGMHGKVALITGASSGIGKGAAEVLANAGAKVFITARREGILKGFKNEIEANGGICEYFVCDVSKEENCKAAVEACVKTFGRLDVLVNNAGIPDKWETDLKKRFDTDNFEKIIGINFNGYFFMIKHAFEECAKHGCGSIINMSSSAAISACGPVVYTATKGAIESLTRLLGVTFAPLGIRVNSIIPGLIETENTAPAIHNEAWAKEYVKQIPIGHFGTVDDINYMVLYLASDASSFVTGHHFIIDGGFNCCPKA